MSVHINNISGRFQLVRQKYVLDEPERVVGVCMETELNCVVSFNIYLTIFYVNETEIERTETDRIVRINL